MARDRRGRQRQQRDQLRMTVINVSYVYDDPLSLAHEIQSCHAALLYADEVTLVSPHAALLNSAAELSTLNGIELLRLLAKVAPKYFPDTAEELAKNDADR